MKPLPLLAVCLFAAHAWAQDAVPARSYPVPDRGALRLSVPEGWTEQVRAEGGMPPTIVLTAPDGSALLQVTALWSPRGEAGFNAPEKIRPAIEKAASLVQPTAVEKELKLQPIATPSGGGYYFSATDRAPKEGEYKFMANGGVPAGPLLLSFTVLSHAEPPRGMEAALAIVRSATHVPSR
jgi:hypothetical protein